MRINEHGRTKAEKQVTTKIQYIRHLLRRTFRRIFTREELWNGNRESFIKGLFTRDSIIVWALKTYSENRNRYLAAQVDPAYAHIDIIRLRTPYDTQVWLSSLPV